MIVIGGEECERVTSFDDLRSGVIVWRMPCSFCGGKHRGILGRLTEGPVSSADIPTRNESYFTFNPATGHSEAGSAVSATTVSLGHVFRVIDRALDAQTTERKREMVRP